MKNRREIITATALVLALGGLAAADYATSGDEYAAWLGNGSPIDTPIETPDENGVAKNAGPDIEATIDAAGFETENSDDLTLLGQIVQEEGVRTVVVLDDGDRAGSVTWVQTPDVKQIFNALKESLITAFSTEMTGLRDVTLQEEGKPVRNVLTFKDPAISEEEIVFVRVRERLFEFHVASGKEEVMNGLIDDLTSR